MPRSNRNSHFRLNNIFFFFSLSLNCKLNLANTFFFGRMPIKSRHDFFFFACVCCFLSNLLVMNFHCLTLAFVSSLLRINCQPTPRSVAILNLSIWLNTPAVHRHLFVIPKFSQLRNIQCQRLIPFWPFCSSRNTFFCFFLLKQLPLFHRFILFSSNGLLSDFVFFLFRYSIHWHLISWDNSMGRAYKRTQFFVCFVFGLFIKSFGQRFVVKLNGVFFCVCSVDMLLRTVIVMKYSWNGSCSERQIMCCKSAITFEIRSNCDVFGMSSAVRTSYCMLYTHTHAKARWWLTSPCWCTGQYYCSLSFRLIIECYVSH